MIIINCGTIMNEVEKIYMIRIQILNESIEMHKERINFLNSEISEITNQVKSGYEEYL